MSKKTVIKEHDRVRLKKPLPSENLPIGVEGTVVMAFNNPPGFFVEFILDGNVYTSVVVTLYPDDIEKV
jgi:hypothetical protein